MTSISITRAASKPNAGLLLAILLLARQVWAVDPNTMVLIHSKDQTFSMGRAQTGKIWTQTSPVHDVRFTYDFLMRATQLTQGQFMSVNNRTNTSKHQVTGDLSLPVERVSWNEAVAYCNDLSKQEGLMPAYSESGEVDLTKNGYRLLTAAENEFVTRARTTTLFSYGDKFNTNEFLYSWNDGAKNRDSTAGNSHGETHDVGTLRPNSYGVYDMTGNLWMWCHDRYDLGSSNNYPATPQVDQTGPATGGTRIARGGAFWNDGDHHETSANHWQWVPDTKNEELGFRICRTVLPSENLEFANVITAPADGATVSGTIPFSATVRRSGGIGVAGVQFRVDGADIGSEIQTAPYAIKWDTTTVANGSHTLAVVARDATGILTSEFETVKVNN